ncbi:pyruvate dehydrogenase (acetyl-transferring) E1 component subunit alpha [Neobacillus sp. MM2021_6]|uniref:pyruvate dehydrogenase (acetyl-transferring) E1 component subunit alpha n=1 Tax=Bacillaceae TaxID=186817 RepID=UPI00140ABFEB|nr:MULTISPECIES: pyruvate dehydrogenase (acetyl-transferring) E1 component subunit alpha [Bacillaceae]MBO0960502.1 pyruvate dehydrogenase (acetyl-transferring) E1 component subunit alpha [Neobacillus sp. MM2021_6]NHC19661.1 pyruvate dehydrogenase (acetyl-transferring) E1 component subunit alpha [Bacillus sp. MM2020_4]
MWLEPNETVVEKIQYLDENGKLTGESPDVKDEELINLYKWMIQARSFDQRALKLQRQGRIGTYAPMIGQEAAQIGSAFSLEKQDWVYPSYREVGVSLVHGVPMENFFLYTMGHLKGTASESANVFPVQIIIGAQCLHAVGGAWAGKYNKENSVSVAYIGDGGTSEGDFHEALNFAGVYKLPVVFFVQNNQWAISVPISKQTGSASISQKAVAYGITGVQVDGNDALAVYSTMKQALERARQGKPVLVEAITYRQGPHTTADDPTKYRDSGELEKWLAMDPLKRMKAFLMEKEIWNEELEQKEYEWADKKVSEAFELAVNTPRSKVEEIFGLVYEQKTNQLTEQLNSIPTEGVLK